MFVWQTLNLLKIMMTTCPSHCLSDPSHPAVQWCRISMSDPRIGGTTSGPRETLLPDEYMYRCLLTAVLGVLLTTNIISCVSGSWWFIRCDHDISIRDNSSITLKSEQGCNTAITVPFLTRWCFIEADAHVICCFVFESSSHEESVLKVHSTHAVAVSNHIDTVFLSWYYLLQTFIFIIDMRLQLRRVLPVLWVVILQECDTRSF